MSAVSRAFTVAVRLLLVSFPSLGLWSPCNAAVAGSQKVSGSEKCCGKVAWCGTGQRPVSSGQATAQRTSLIVAWWGPGGPHARKGAPGSGPCRVLPKTPEALLAQHGHSWLPDFQVSLPKPGGSGSSSKLLKPKSSWGAARMVAPAWVPVTREGAGNAAADESTLGQEGRTFGGMRRSDRIDSCAAVTSNLPLPALHFFLRMPDELQRVYVHPESQYYYDA